MDDQKDARDLLVGWVELQGGTAIVASDGQYLFDNWETVRDCDGIITDVTMQNIHGIEILGFLAGKGCSIPVLVVSAVKIAPDGYDLSKVHEIYEHAKFYDKMHSGDGVKDLVERIKQSGESS